MVPNATVIAANAASGAESKTATTATGNYRLPSLPAGVYTLTVAVTGLENLVCTLGASPPG